jgi:hypothetical protein
VTGIVWLHSQFVIKDIKDGLSTTYMVGEKYLDAELAELGTSQGDLRGPFASDDRDPVRWATGLVNNQTVYAPPQRDAVGNPQNVNDTAYGLSGLGTYNFGSAHPSGFNMALCDASVRHINYDIEQVIHRQLCNRQDKNLGDPLTGLRFEIPSD